MTSQNLASNCSSHDNLKIRVRCGLMSLVDQTRCTVALDTPTCLAIERVLHRPTPPGGLTASLKILPLSDGLMRSGRPLRANSAKPPIPSRRKRPRQNVTVCWLVPKVLATCTLSAPVAHARIRRARKTIRFSLVPALAIRSNSWRCVSVSSKFAFGRPAILRSYTRSSIIKDI